MRRSALLPILVCLFISARAFADGRSCQLDKFFSSLRQEADIVITEGAHEVDRSLLFYELDRTVKASSRVELELRVLGELFLIEEISLTESNRPTGAVKSKGDDAAAVIELLANYPAQRTRLHHLASETEATLRLDGELVESLSYEELVAGSETLREQMPLPRPVTSRLVYPSAEGEARQIAVKGACENNCQLELDYCESWCGGDGYCLSRCEASYYDCLENCSSQGCTPSSQTVVVTNLVSSVGTNVFDCLWVPPFYNYSNTFEWTRFRFKNTEKQIVTYADCSTSETILSIWYTDQYCWLDSFPLHCPGPAYGLYYCF